MVLRPLTEVSSQFGVVVLILYRVTNGSPIVRKHFNLPRHRIDSVTEYRGRSCALRLSKYGINRAARIAKYSSNHANLLNSRFLYI